MNLYGGIEAGGTKFICAIGTGPKDLRDEIRFDTTLPEETINNTINYFKNYSQCGELSAIGIGSFGPIDLNPESPTYGYILSTPKQNWKNTNILGKIKSALNIPVGFDTDVNAAALGEYEWGAAKGLSNFIYLTIGTGIGGGGMINGKLLHGILHPEMGHIFIPHNFKEDPFAGNCPFHGDCFEGLASGPAIEARWGIIPQKLDENHEGWKLEAKYISLAITNYICTLSPQRIIIGGGVMNREKLLPMVHREIVNNLNTYIQLPEITQNIEDYIVLPGLGNQAGILGAIALARRVHSRSAKYKKCDNSIS